MRFLALEEGDQRCEEDDECRRCDGRAVERFTGAVMCLTASRWAHGDDSFEEMDFRFVLSQLVDSLAFVVAVLTLLDCDDAQSRVGELIGGGEVRDAVVLVVRQNDVVLDPDDCGWWIGFDVTFNVHVVLQSLPETRTRGSDDRRELDFQVDVSAISTAHTVVSNAIVRSTIFLAH